FSERGLPQAIRSDNGVPFASPNALFNLSKLSVWWLRLGIDIEGIWIVSFMPYDLGYIDLEQKTLQPLDTPSARGCHPCPKYDPLPMSPVCTFGHLVGVAGFEPATPSPPD
ncbi:MAG: hypothetical protein ACREDT_16005, partial [Methylocella sp.]